MPPKIKKTVVIILLNIGNSSKEGTFLEKSKYAARLLVEKKIFLQPKDELALFTIGDETNNYDDIDNVKEYCQHLLNPNWEMVKYIDSLLTTNHPSNWIEGLFAVLSFAKREITYEVFKLFVVIFNNFKEDADCIKQFDSDMIINDLRNYENLNLLFIGEKSLEQINQYPTSESEKFMVSFINEFTAQYEELNNFIETRQFYLPPPVQSLAWKFNLVWGDISIPCSSYIKVADTVKSQKWNLKTMKETEGMINVVKEKIDIDLHRNKIEKEDIINGYKFGNKYIPVSDNDEFAMKYSGSKKGMIIYGFIDEKHITFGLRTGSGSRIIVPYHNDYFVNFYSLLEAMDQKKCVAIVRKVYLDNNLPKMGILFPQKQNNEIWCLVHLELPFSNDIRVLPVKKMQLFMPIKDDKETTAMNNFIDAITICNNEPYYLNKGMFPNVSCQYKYNAFAARVLYPDKPVIKLNDYLEKYLRMPTNLNEKAQLYLEELHNIFQNANKTVDKKTLVDEVVENCKDSTEDFYTPTDVDDIMKEIDDF